MVFESRIPASLKSLLEFIPDGPNPLFAPPSTPVLGPVTTGELPVVPLTGVVVPGVVVVVPLHSINKLCIIY